MKFAKYAYMIAGIWGVLVCIPPYFAEVKVGTDYPPPITHPEFYYGFYGLVLAWQIMFFIIASDPVRYRPAMVASMFEKAAFVIAVPILYIQGRVASIVLFFAFVDLLLGILFVLAFLKTAKRQFVVEV